MTNVILSQLDIEAEISRLSGILEDRTQNYGDAIQEAATAEARYRVAHAKAFVRARILEKLAERTADATATVECEELLLDRKAKEGLARALEEACRSLREQLGAVRTLSANIRSQT
jgi:hypothetical protein